MQNKQLQKIQNSSKLLISVDTDTEIHIIKDKKTKKKLPTRWDCTVAVFHIFNQVK